MLIYDSSKTAALVNVTLKNLQGNTTTTDGASADGLTVKEDLTTIGRRKSPTPTSSLPI